MKAPITRLAFVGTVTDFKEWGDMFVTGENARGHRALRPFIGWEPAEGRDLPKEKLVVDGVAVDALLDRFPTPFYVTSIRAFEERLTLYRQALRAYFPRSRVYYALKANWSVPLIEAVARSGEGFDIVSLGELRHLEKAQVSSHTICFAGVGKSPAEIEAALYSEVGMINVEHPSELILALDALKRVPSKTAIALRLNPCLDVDTHAHLRTGALDSKFGMLASQIFATLDHPELRSLLSEKDARGHELREAVSGVHIHVGSQLLSGVLFEKVVGAVVDLCAGLAGRGLRIDHLDFGGGLGVGFDGVPLTGEDVNAHARGLYAALQDALLEHPSLAEMWGKDLGKVEVCLEPGRSLVASSSLFLTKVLYTRINDTAHRFAYVDAGMNDFPRPSLYGASHAVVRVRAAPQDDISSWRQAFEPTLEGGKGLQIVGPVCESADVLARDPNLDKLNCGDVLAFLEAGAYCRSMASEYNLRSLPRTVFIREGEVVAESH